ncbi:DC1 [Arabidopsis thaliana x Arabidopsis arenosa]|uniref:DC1 n=1 Tax=Arabidopsis thaliana x Arabidopsis arenosa TaxID=1240361 RepID=A0A8T1ZLY1_9BRAS|nr:DC1 [Arabidopsis thaliana x Arabidopsis arenosa]
MDPEPQLQLLSLVTQLMSYIDRDKWETGFVSEVILLIRQTISLVNSMDLDLQPKPESELMSLITQTISLIRSMDLNSQPKPIREFISFISQNVNSIDSDWEEKFLSLFIPIFGFVEESELISLLYEICYLATSMDPQWEKLIPVRFQAYVILKDGKFHVIEEVKRNNEKYWMCLPLYRKKFSFSGGDATHFRCRGCNGENHEEFNNAPVEIKHHLHPKHSLQLVMLEDGETRKCYCCDEDLKEIFYYCSTCDVAMNMFCVDKPPALSIDHPKWHEHTLALFPSQASLPCNLCALTHSSCPFYICPPCDFVVHQRCISLPRVIRISRHPHRISFTASFEQGDWLCAVCRRKIDNDNGGYSCSKDGCSYAAHSRCATQRNVWDGIELEGEPEEIEEVEPPFVRISDGIIQHFSHPHHHLRLDENTGRDYDEDKQCQACIMPIYFGKFYSCMQCEFILHETCVNLSRKIYHPIHPHLLTLVGGYDGFINYIIDKCSACQGMYKAGFFYECREGCSFQLHVQCTTISEPLVHESHMHPLFLTSKPGEERICSVCENQGTTSTKETFNCIEECDFSLCFGCATLPQKVRYKHDKHTLTLSYGEETSTMMYWCEICEREINPKKRFYMCDEYCCVTLHIDCMLGVDFYTKPGSSLSLFESETKVYILPNNHHMSRPICCFCEKRCPHKIVLQSSGIFFCSIICHREMMFDLIRNHQISNSPFSM